MRQLDSLCGVNSLAKLVSAKKKFCEPDGVEKYAVCMIRVFEASAAVARNEWMLVSDVAKVQVCLECCTLEAAVYHQSVA